jgi:GTP-binding protein LepA
MSDQSLTRNFCIIAHVDHGKTTLSDRLLQATSTVSDRILTEQHLDSMDLERERGITIKAHPVTMAYTSKAGETYMLNLIDTPGHVDFAYEVSRSLAACDGALLIIDAAQGVEAQTVANVHLANKQNLKLIPVINKIDLPSADIETCKRQLEEVLSIPAEEAILASAKNGIGITDILEAIIERIPPPPEKTDDYTRALVFDSLFDTYRGVVNYVRIVSGELKPGTPILLMGSNNKYEVKEVGIFTPKQIRTATLRAGQVGYLVANIKSTAEVKIGETITNAQKPAPEPLPGFKAITPMVFSGIYPIDTSQFEQLKIALGKLQLNDAALTYSTESSVALGFGFRCGFLGLLHMEIVQERLRREYQMDIIATYPSVVYEVTRTNGEVEMIDNPTQMPDPSVIESIAEPMVKAFIMIPNENIGDIMGLVMEKRGTCEHTESLDAKRVMLHCDLPLNEILVDFNDRIKSITRGYGSMDYEYAPYRISDMVKMDMLVNAEPLDAFSCIVERSKAPARGRHIAAKLKEVIHPHLFKIAIQAAIGGKIIAREDVKSVGKNVTAKCYGGDISRKRKLLEKQKEGKKRMKSIGNVDIPQEAFIAVLKSESK